MLNAAKKGTMRLGVHHLLFYCKYKNYRLDHDFAVLLGIFYTQYSYIHFDPVDFFEYIQKKISYTIY